MEKINLDQTHILEHVCEQCEVLDFAARMQIIFHKINDLKRENIFPQIFLKLPNADGRGDLHEYIATHKSVLKDLIKDSFCLIIPSYQKSVFNRTHARKKLVHYNVRFAFEVNLRPSFETAHGILPFTICDLIKTDIQTSKMRSADFVIGGLTNDTAILFDVFDPDTPALWGELARFALQRFLMAPELSSREVLGEWLESILGKGAGTVLEPLVNKIMVAMHEILLLDSQVLSNPDAPSQIFIDRQRLIFAEPGHELHEKMRGVFARISFFDSELKKIKNGIGILEECITALEGQFNRIDWHDQQKERFSVSLVHALTFCRVFEPYLHLLYLYFNPEKANTAAILGLISRLSDCVEDYRSRFDCIDMRDIDLFLNVVRKTLHAHRAR